MLRVDPIALLSILGVNHRRNLEPAETTAIIGTHQPIALTADFRVNSKPLGMPILG